MKYILSKTIGVVLGTIMVIAAFGYGFLYLLGTSLGHALGSEMDTTASDRSTLVILMFICTLGVITGAGCFGVKFKGWRIMYIGFSLLTGIAFLVTYFISIGAIGKKYEFVILFTSILHFLLGYLVIKER